MPPAHRRRGINQHVLQVRFGLTTIPCAAQSKGTYCL